MPGALVEGVHGEYRAAERGSIAAVRMAAALMRQLQEPCCRSQAFTAAAIVADDDSLLEPLHEHRQVGVQATVRSI